jgi:hypothetical protein
MDERVRALTREVKKLDAKLYAYRASNGMIQIHREGDRLEASDFNQSAPELARLNPQFILALTDTWTLQGQPVEWGLEPVLTRLREMDSWNSGFSYEAFTKERDRRNQDKERVKRNNIRAIASDLRKDFAKATNDINTSSFDVKEKMKNGYYQSR